MGRKVSLGLILLCFVIIEKNSVNLSFAMFIFATAAGFCHANANLVGKCQPMHLLYRLDLFHVIESNLSLC